MMDGAELTRPQPKIVTPSQAALEALAHTREATLFMRQAADKLLEISQLEQTPPELHTIIINGANNPGQYDVNSRSRWEAKSIGVLNPTSVPIFVGIGGISATPTSRAPAVPPASLMVLPIIARNIELGADPAVLLGNTAVVYLFRYLTVQPAFLGRGS